MKLWKRLQFAWKYDIDPEFIVVPLGQETTISVMSFTEYDKAEAWIEQDLKDKPWFGKNSVLVRVKRKVIK